MIFKTKLKFYTTVLQGIDFSNLEFIVIKYVDLTPLYPTTFLSFC